MVAAENQVWWTVLYRTSSSVDREFRPMVATIGHCLLLGHSVNIHGSIKLKFGAHVAVASTYLLDQKQGPLLLPFVLCSRLIMWGVR